MAPSTMDGMQSPLVAVVAVPAQDILRDLFAKCLGVLLDHVEKLLCTEMMPNTRGPCPQCSRSRRLPLKNGPSLPLATHNFALKADDQS